MSDLGYWVFARELAAHVGMWAVRQSPYPVPENLETVLRKFQEVLKTTGGFDVAVHCKGGMRRFQTRRELIKFLNEHLKPIPEFAGWNERKNKRDGHGFVSALDGERDPDDDFIDLDALIGNVAMNLTALHDLERAERAQEPDAVLAQSDAACEQIAERFGMVEACPDCLHTAGRREVPTRMPRASQRRPGVIRAVLFDVDGVLLDSLEPHLQFARDKTSEFRLDLEIPSAEQVRKLNRNPLVKLSPMFNFFMSVGFPPSKAELAARDYERDFARNYSVAPYDGVRQMLCAIHDEASYRRIPLGIVTANTMNNVAAGLGATLRHFDSRLCFDARALRPKRDSLLMATNLLTLTQNQVLYIGDVQSDLHAAQDAGVDFIGVSYGWGLEREETRCPMVHSVEDLGFQVLSRIQNG